LNHDVLNFSSVNVLVQKRKHFSYVVYNKNERFIKLMCGDEENFEKAYEAAKNALDYGKDYSYGACYWDGYDLKVSGTKHAKYKEGFRYSNPSHNIFPASEPPYKRRKGRKHGYYDNKYISTTTQGKTIFWKLDEQYLEANGGRECN
jgi:hypothetical protein